MELRRNPAGPLVGETEELIQRERTDPEQQPFADDAGLSGERHHRHRDMSTSGEKETTSLHATLAKPADLCSDHMPGRGWQRERRAGPGGHDERPP
jgi:hypothetical protein